MKKILFTIGVLFIGVTLSIAQKVIIGQYPTTVPFGKKWILQTNQEILVELQPNIMSGSMCDAQIRSNPGIISVIKKYDLRKTNYNYTLLFNEISKVAFSNNNTFKVVPISIANIESDLELLGKVDLKKIGKKEIVFYPGDVVSVGLCIKNLQLFEMPLSKKELVELKWREDEIKKENEYEKKMELEKNERRIEEENRKNELLAYTFDLYEYNTTAYNVMYFQIRDYLLNCFKEKPSSRRVIRIPSFQELDSSKGRKFVLRNIYKARFVLEDHRPKNNNRNLIIASSSSDIIQNADIELISGTDEECRLFEKFSGKIRTITIENVEVMTEATYDSLHVEFTRGITSVEIKNSEVKFLSEEPDSLVKIFLTDKLKTKSDGLYSIKYDWVNILGKKEITLYPEENELMMRDTTSSEKAGSQLEDFWAIGFVVALVLVKIFGL
ncbi:MAG: hypothetical protein FD143_1844 [Ignavibacteria bacterium]|nr:MAG: hypothetical protein FD143_1844 [Ignavibacteria bacterium]KAF0157710.1 MAG: hypothetical protein FD188_2689 [Ignavibacteria bacterium]